MIKSRSDFTISFSDEGLDRAFSTYVLAVDLGTELFTEEGTRHQTNAIIVWLADDEESVVMNAIRSHKNDTPFNVTVKVGREIFVYRDATLAALQHSIFTREDHSEHVSMSGPKGAMFVGVLAPPESRKASAKLLKLQFTSFEHYLSESTIIQ